MPSSTTPVISICDEHDIEITRPWKVGTLDVNSGSSLPESETKVLHIWNNRGNSTGTTADLVSAYITTKNISGDNSNEQVVIDKWVQASCEALSPDLNGDGIKDMTPIGGDDKLMICANDGAASTKADFKISGAENAGSYDANPENVAKICLKVVPKINALKGLHQFKVRVSGYYT